MNAFETGQSQLQRILIIAQRHSRHKSHFLNVLTRKVIPWLVNQINNFQGISCRRLEMMTTRQAHYSQTFLYETRINYEQLTAHVERLALLTRLTKKKKIMGIFLQEHKLQNA